MNRNYRIWYTIPNSSHCEQVGSVEEGWFRLKNKIKTHPKIKEFGLEYWDNDKWQEWRNDKGQTIKDCFRDEKGPL